MKIAIISVTRQGALLGQKLAASLLRENECFIYEKEGRESGEKTAAYDRLRPLLQDIWQSYDAFVFIMAVGIVVRDIASLLQHKSVDPAVVVLDERGFNCISLLSGHLGGANELARKVAFLSGANPVITTASDINGKVVPDAIAKKLGFSIDSYNVLKKVNGCIVAGEKVGCFVDKRLPEKEAFIVSARKLGMDFSVWHEDIDTSDTKGIVYLSEYEEKLPFSNTLYLRPESIIAGIGCKRDVPEEKLRESLHVALEKLNINKKCVKAICSAWVKADEKGLLSLADRMNIPIRFYDKETLEKTISYYNLVKSNFAEKQIGVGNVCEAAAMSFARQITLIKGKESYGGVTIALARVDFLSQE